MPMNSFTSARIDSMMPGGSATVPRGRRTFDFVLPQVLRDPMFCDWKSVEEDVQTKEQAHAV
jgi:hypothetical protein